MKTIGMKAQAREPLAGLGNQKSNQMGFCYPSVNVIKNVIIQSYFRFNGRIV